MRLVPLLLLFLSCSRCIGAEAPIAVWPPQPIPTGGNPAAIASPRLEWINEVMGKAAAAKKANAEHPVELIFDGDSITDWWKNAGREIWTARYEPLHAVNFGTSSDSTQHLLWRLQAGQAAGFDAKLVIVLIGTNNLLANTPEEIAGGIKSIVIEYEKICPHARILLLGLLPRSQSPMDGMRSRLKAVNEKIASLGSDKRVTCLDIGDKFLEADGAISKTLMPDFLHPSAAGYQVFANAIQPVIDSIFPPRPGGMPNSPTTTAPRSK